MRHANLAGAISAIAAIVVMLAACGGSTSPSTQVKRVGLMHVGLDHVPPSLKPLKKQLRELGWVQGENVDLIWRNLPSESAALVQARAFVRQRVDLIVAFEDQSVRQAKAATAVSRTPVVFLHPVDPVRAGYVKSLRYPGANLTGVFGLRDLVAKQLELYKAVVPQLRRVLALVDPQDPSTPPLLKQSETAAHALHLDLVVKQAATPDELIHVFGALRKNEVQAAFVVSPKLIFNDSQLLIGLAEGEAHLPLELNRKEWVEKGALFSYGPDFELIGSEGARYVNSILRGAKPQNLPVEEEPRVQFTLNLTTAQKLGIHVPESTVILADRVFR